MPSFLLVLLALFLSLGSLAQQTHLVLLQADPGLACDVVGVSELGTALTIYPNPAGDVLHVTLPTDGATLRLLTSDGREVLRSTCATERCRVALDGIAPGIYFVEAKGTLGRNVARIAIVR